MSLNMKVVSLDKIHNFCIGKFEVFREILENAAKVSADTAGSKGVQGV
jgi:hypothetical protein